MEALALQARGPKQADSKRTYSSVVGVSHNIGESSDEPRLACLAFGTPRISDSTTPPAGILCGMTIASQSKLFLLDDNVRSVGGHFLELASLLIDGAQQLGYSTQLAAHQSFDDWADLPPHIELDSAFQVCRMMRWTLGVDGLSVVRRDLHGSGIGPEILPRMWQTIRDPLSRRDCRPSLMLERWSNDFLDLLEKWNPGPNDRLLINTGDDFLMLALAKALRVTNTKHPLNIDVIFHFAVFDHAGKTLDEALPPRRAVNFGRQVNDALASSSPHRVSLFTTTESLSCQFAAVGVQTRPIPYPTRDRDVNEQVTSQTKPMKLLMAGLPRAEKGRREIRSLLQKIKHSHLSNGDYQLSMQMPIKGWKRTIPQEFWSIYREALAKKGINDLPLEILSSDLSSIDYHAWLDTASIGLFLYDSNRYAVRCSGVLLEMMARGVPVIVPAKCWLADQVLLAGGDRSIGRIFVSTSEIPDLIDQMKADYGPLRERAGQYAKVIAQRHSPLNTLKQMGLPVSDQFDQTSVRKAA